MIEDAEESTKHSAPEEEEESKWVWKKKNEIDWINVIVLLAVLLGGTYVFYMCITNPKAINIKPKDASSIINMCWIFFPLLIAVLGYQFRK